MNLLLDYHNGGTLKKLIKKKASIPEEKARTIIMQLLLSVDYMVKLGIIHRDLKPENILINK